MNNVFKNFAMTYIFFNLLLPYNIIGQNWTEDENDLIKRVEEFLFAAGNYNIEAMAEMMTDHANVGSIKLKNGERVINTMTIQDFFEIVKNRTARPYFEPVKEYTIHLNDDHLAFVRADATLYAYGIPQSHNMDYFTLMKEDGAWMFLSLSYTPTPIPEDEKVFDLNIFGKSYAQAWCSQRPDFVSFFFAEDGSLSVNDGKPAVGRVEISKVAESFMTAFPDIIVMMDSLIQTAKGTKFHWTFTGTNTGPNGTGRKVKIRGVEIWLIEKGLIKESKGSFDTEDYERQVKYGIEE